MNRNDDDRKAPTSLRNPGQPARFDAAGAWADALAMLRGNRAILPVLAGLFFLVPQVLTSALIPDIPAGLEGEAASKAALAIFADWWPMMLAALLVQALGLLAIMAVLADRERPTVGEALRMAVRHLPVYVAATLVIAAGIGILALLVMLPLTIAAGQTGAAVAIVALLPVALWINVRTLPLAPVVAAGREGNPFEAIKRSWALTAGRTARLLFFAFVFFIAAMVVSIVLTAVPGAVLIALLGQETGAALVAVIEGIVTAAIMLVWSTLIVAIFRQLAA